ncbi:hypothetical protein O3M35_010090 [Rhynocoris fuscipes]|uniref:Lipase n=1 Tax=Rhynocoris fuscipes TaxID=488301 RepID=A0AAW1CYZ1_9HEMI
MLFIRDILILTIVFIYNFQISISQNQEICDINLPTLFRVTAVPPEKRSILPPGFTTTEEIIRRNGFGYKKYQGITEDGYILTYHRIITKTPGGQPVLFVPGLSLASDCWLLTGRKTDLAFQLADAGYDVWLGDRRGNWYSRAHVQYKPTSKEFWDFSFHESAIYDLPVFIDGIIHRTKYSKVIFFGHSMSGTEFFVLMSVRPEYNDKIKIGIQFAPVAIAVPIKELKSPIWATVFSISDIIYRTLNYEGKYELAPRDAKLVETFRKCCAPSNFQEACFTFFGLSFGDNRQNYNKTLMGEKMSHWPSGAALKTVYHMTQLFKTGEFRYFDYGMAENLRRYNRTTPPLYPLERVTAPVAIYFGGNDAFLNQRAIDKLVSRLPNVVEVHKIEDPMYNHMDFIWGINTSNLVNKRIIKLLIRFKE